MDHGGLRRNDGDVEGRRQNGTPLSGRQQSLGDAGLGEDPAVSAIHTTRPGRRRPAIRDRQDQGVPWAELSLERPVQLRRKTEAGRFEDRVIHVDCRIQHHRPKAAGPEELDAVHRSVVCQSEVERQRTAGTVAVSDETLVGPHEIWGGVDHHPGARRVTGRHHPLEFEPNPMVLQILVEKQLATGIGVDQRIDHQQVLRAIDIEIGHDRRISAELAFDGLARSDVGERQVPVVVVEQVRVRAEEILVGHIQVAFPIVVMVDEGRAPTHAPVTDSGRLRDVREGQDAAVFRLGSGVEEEVVGQIVGDVQVEVAVVVEVRGVHPHALRSEVKAPSGRLVRERPCAIVDVELVGLIPIVGQIQVQIPIVLDVEEQGPHPD